MKSERTTRGNSCQIYAATPDKKREFYVATDLTRPACSAALAARLGSCAGVAGRDLCQLPRYLLALGVTGLRLHIADWAQHAFINILWNTGARLNEALALHRRDFRLNNEIPHVVIRTAKQRRAGSGRPRGDTSPNRVVPLSDPAYVDEMRQLFASVRGGV